MQPHNVMTRGTYYTQQKNNFISPKSFNELEQQCLFYTYKVGNILTKTQSIMTIIRRKKIRNKEGHIFKNKDKEKLLYTEDLGYLINSTSKNSKEENCYNLIRQ